MQLEGPPRVETGPSTEDPGWEVERKEPKTPQVYVTREQSMASERSFPWRRDDSMVKKVDCCFISLPLYLRQSTAEAAANETLHREGGNTFHLTQPERPSEPSKAA